jgi:peroxiredoxin
VELPRLQPLYEKYQARGFNVVAIDGLRDTQGATTFIQQNGLTYTMLETGEGEADVVRETFGIGGFPTSYLIDQDGRIVYYHLGFSEGDEVALEKEILKLLES